MPLIYRNFDITIGKETRSVECLSFDDGEHYESVDPVAFARIGRVGSKLWPAHVTVWRKKDGSYRESMQARHLNRAGAIVEWNRPELYLSQSRHNSAEGLKFYSDSNERSR